MNKFISSSPINHWENLNPTSQKIIQGIIFFFPIVFAGIFALVKIITNNSGIYWYFTAEDSLIEDASSLVYFLACFCTVLTALSLRKRGLKKYGNLMIVLSLMFLFIAMEEISWGQRFLRIESPEFFQKHNYQNEITLHNIGSGYILHGAYIIMGIYGCFGRKLLPKNLKKKYKTFCKFFVPTQRVFFYFLPVLVFYFYHDYISSFFVAMFGPGFGFNTGHFLIRKDQEFWEFLMGLGWLVFVAGNLLGEKYLTEKSSKLSVPTERSLLEETRK